MRRAVIDATFVFALSILVLLVGEPQPFAIIVGGAGALTGAYILVRAVDRHHTRSDR